MDTVAVFAGQTLTIGSVVSFLAQFLKQPILAADLPGKKWIVRIGLVALPCLAVNVLVSFATGGTVSWDVLLELFFSYVVAAAQYDHFYKA